MLTLVCATRWSTQAFPTQTLLGTCLPRLGQSEPFALKLFANNKLPLAEAYNTAIDEAQPDDILVFLHDDVFLDDWHLAKRLREALAHFDVVGVAGNRRRLPGQHAWYLLPLEDTPEGVPDWQRVVRDTPFLSGEVAHGSSPMQSQLTVFGPCPQEVCVLDGVFLAARAQRLQATGLRFDPSLAFHFYDLDFCRSAQALGLRLGTWPMALTHKSSGNSLHSDGWLQARRRYVTKWRD